jgi:hypothetical protein
VNANFVQATLRDLLKNNATRVLSLADAGIMFDYPLYPVRQQPHMRARTHAHTHDTHKQDTRHDTTRLRVCDGG